MNETTKPNGRRRSALTLAFLLLAATMSIMFAGAAQAATQSGCTATPLKPVFSGSFTSAGVKLVYYPVKVSCDFLRKAEIRQRFYEVDAPNGFQEQGNRTLTFDGGVFGGSTTLYGPSRPLINTEPGNEEIAHKISFRVWTNADTAVSAWAAWENSPELSILD